MRNVGGISKSLSSCIALVASTIGICETGTTLLALVARHPLPLAGFFRIQNFVETRKSRIPR